MKELQLWRFKSTILTVIKIILIEKGPLLPWHHRHMEAKFWISGPLWAISVQTDSVLCKTSLKYFSHVLRSKLHPLICEAQSHIRTDTKPSKSNNTFWNTTTCVYRRTWKTRGGPDLVRASWVHLSLSRVFGKYQKFRATNFKMGTKWGSCKHYILENSEARICIQTWFLKPPLRDLSPW